MLLKAFKGYKRNFIIIAKRFRSFSFPESKTFINGQWVSAIDGKNFKVLNPSNREVVGIVPDCGVSDLNVAIESAVKAFDTWKRTTAKERGAFLRRMFDLHIQHIDDLARILTLEGGKHLKEAKGEISYGAAFFEWFGEEARRIYGDIVQSPFKDKQMFFIRQPIGVAGIITPWNFPNAMITRKVGAALAAGCTCVIKPAAETPLSALAIARTAELAGLPPGVLNVVPTAKGKASVIGKSLCQDDRVATVSFTGSTDVGKRLLEYSAPFVKRVSLELGGNAPFIVFESADISKAVEGAMASKFRNSGQTCVCTNRILVQDKVYDKFIEELKNAMKSQLIVGDGLDPKTTIGPLISESAAEGVDKHVRDAEKKGALVEVGGKIAALGNTFYEPTLLTGITRDMLISCEETFGPVAGVMKFSSEAEAIEIANSVRTGLAGYFYSSDISQIWRVAKALEVGMVGANEGIISCPEAAFGGIKESGIGREGSRYGIDEYVNMKYICIGGLE